MKHGPTQLLALPPGYFAVHMDDGTADGLWREPVVAIALVTEPDGVTRSVYPVRFSIDLGPEVVMDEACSLLGYEWPGQPPRSAEEWKNLGGKS